jgi:hypothetical protein
MTRRVFALSMHATYRCEHAGACCTAGWTIPVERPLRARLGGASALVPAPDGTCHQYDGAARRCRIHRNIGEGALPIACRVFPRLALTDERGTFVTLSHFCATAAQQLVQHRMPLEIVEGPPAFPAGATYDGLDACGQWPPLIKPDLAFDLAGYDAWERFIIRTCAREELDVDGALDRIATAAERVRAWRPGSGTLAACVGAAEAEDTADPDAAARYAAWRATGGWRTAVDAATTRAAGEGQRPPAPRLDLTIGPRDGVVRRYVAARAFGSWSAYQASDIRTMVAELVVCASVLTTEAARLARSAGRPLDDTLTIAAVRAADGLLVHGVDRARLLRALAPVEGARRSTRPPHAPRKVPR